MIYICIPSFDEAQTVGVLLWRIRKVFREYAREYELLVYDDASTDATRELLQPYTKALPLTVLGGRKRVGYGRAVDALLREVSQRTRYPRRDAVILLQADFTDQPEGIPELVKRFEGGADVVVAERVVPAAAPEPVRKLHRLAALLTRVPRVGRGSSFFRFFRVSRFFRFFRFFAVTETGVRDPFGTFRLLRITVVRDMLRDAGDEPITKADAPWQANLELLRAAAAVARRVESVELPQRYDVRQRATRRDPWPDAWALARAAWANRSRRPASQPVT